MIRRFHSLFKSDGLKGRTLRGTLASIWLAGGEQMLRFASNLVLTRLLFPEAFGLMALVQVVIGGMLMLSDVGLRGAVVQNARGDDPMFLNTIWTVQILRGVVLWGIVSLLGGVFAGVFDQPELTYILPVAGLTLIIQGLYSTKVLTAQRHLQLGRHAWLTLIAQAIGLVMMSALAYMLQSVWALVIGMLVQPAIAVVFYARYLEGHSDRLALERDSLRDIFNLGKFLTVSSIATYVMTQSDRAVLGTIISIDLLGIYGLALALTMMPMTLTQRLAGSVVFPLYRMRHPLDSAANQRNLFRVRRILVAGGLALLGTIALLGPWLIDVLYDDRYQAAGGISVLLATAFMPRMIMVGVMNTTVAKGNSYAMMMVNLSTAVIQLALLVFLAPQLGIIAAAIAIAAGPVLTYPVAAVYLRQYKTWDLWGDLMFCALSVAITSLALWMHWESIVALV